MSETQTIGVPISEAQTIEHHNVGYDWNYSIEVERVVAVEGTRASAKTTEKFSVGGNTQYYGEAMDQMKLARTELAREVNKQ